MNKTIFVYQSPSTFVNKDLACLHNFSKVVKFEVGPVKGISALLKNVIVAFKILLSIHNVNLIYMWFVDFHAFFPILIGRLLGIRTVVVVGGSDAVSIPSLKIGLFSSNKFRQWVGRFCYRHSDFVLVVDKSLIEGINKYADVEGNGLPTGFLALGAKPKGRIETVPTGYDGNFWNYNSSIVRKNGVVSVGFIHNEVRWKLKGGDLLNDVAFHMPETDFYFYGISKRFRDILIASGNIAPNFHLVGEVDNKSLPDVFSSFKIYAQLSLTEGLPNVLCEAMLCGCIPVGSEVNGIPDAIGDTGVIVPRKDVRMASEAIKIALNMGEDIRGEARARIIEKFPWGKREEKLKELFFK